MRSHPPPRSKSFLAHPGTHGTPSEHADGQTLDASQRPVPARAEHDTLYTGCTPGCRPCESHALSCLGLKAIDTNDTRPHVLHPHRHHATHSTERHIHARARESKTQSRLSIDGSHAAAKRERERGREGGRERCRARTIDTRSAKPIHTLEKSNTRENQVACPPLHMSNGTDLHRDPSVLLCLEEGKNLFAHFVRGWDARARLQLAVRLKHKYAAIIRVAKFAERRRGFIVLGQLGQLLRLYHLAPSAHSARGEEGTAGRPMASATQTRAGDNRVGGELTLSRRD